MHKNEFADAKSFWRNHIYHITVQRFQVVSSQFLFEMKFILFGILIIFLVQKGAETNEDEKFDPVEAMRQLLEQEVTEGAVFRQQLREQGVNVEEWEEKFSQEDFDLNNNEQGDVREELWFYRRLLYVFITNEQLNLLTINVYISPSSPPKSCKEAVWS